MENTKEKKTYVSLKAYYQTLIKHLMSYNKKQDDIRKKDSTSGNLAFRFDIPKATLLDLSKHMRKIFKMESNLLKLEAPFYLFGDIHGQFSDLVRFLEMIFSSTKNKKDQRRLIFNGDIVDRGSCSIECLVMLFCLKFCAPNHIFVLRGNHESSDINKMYGFYGECIERYGKVDGEEIWKDLNMTLHLLPICCTINGSIFCTHGGIPRQPLNSLDDINKINRNVPIGDNGILCDLMWSDPKTHKANYMANDRGVSHTFNQTALNQFMKKHNLFLVCRAHQMVNEGYKFFGGNKLITIFSAPNYCGEMGNNGAVMYISTSLECSFIILKPIKKK